jgi:NADPH2:quinone reductase
MKAIFYREFGDRNVLTYGDMPDPNPGAGELLMKTARTSVNFVDIRERQGVYNKPETHGGKTYLPHTPGLQAVGIVTEVGDGVDRKWIGRRVMAYTPAGGGYAQQTVARAEFCVPIPDGYGDDLFAALPNQGLTARLLLTASAQLRGGETILVQGASGGVGSLIVPMAKAMGAGQILGTASSAEKLDFIRQIGADNAIDYSDDRWVDHVLERTGGKGVDIILESVGGDIFEKNFDCLAPFGRYVVYGSTRGSGQPVPPRRLMGKAQSLIGFYLPVFLQRPELIRNGLQYLVAAAMQGKVVPSIARILPLSEAAEAHRILEDREVRGILLLDTTFK